MAPNLTSLKDGCEGAAGAGRGGRGGGREKFLSVSEETMTNDCNYREAGTAGDRGCAGWEMSVEMAVEMFPV